MKFFAVFVLIAAVASAEQPKRPSAIIGAILEAIAAVRPEPAEIGPIADSEPISVGPAIVEPEYEPISVGPAIVPFPMPDDGEVTAPIVAPSPVAIVEGPAPELTGSAPLVQIILNINQAAGSVAVSPVDIIKPTPVQVVDAAPEPVQVVETAPEPVQVVEVAPEPVQVVEVAPEPVQVVEVAPVPAEPVQIGVPVLPEAAVVLPEQLN
ncbi:hypothetical protein PYW08_005762 [Mythimna loreyi]|uniref:Uncharacterized protein n=1 Tax=Mythimna loreyi TaxID=667449 RepID=A0ACC2QHG6_9NEOP|nr:hypothetical protein PYW08_005762 [Mythimna loreyi]